VIKGFEKGFDYEKFVLQCENPIPQPSSFIRRRVIDRVGMLDPAYYYFMDWDFWLRAGLQHRIVYVPEVLSTYRLHSESKTVSQSLKAAPELERMYKLYFENRDLPKNILKIKSKAMANMYFATGGYLLKGDDRISALAASQKALLSDPWLLTTRQGLQKLAYCSLGHKSMYKWGRSTWYQIQEVVGLR
jgi:GT2 family glycosyltransferase